VFLTTAQIGDAAPAGATALVSDVSTGLMHYDSLRNMAAQVIPNRSRPKYAGVQPTPEEAKEALTGRTNQIIWERAK
jgi:hypothetical protein